MTFFWFSCRVNIQSSHGFFMGYASNISRNLRQMFFSTLAATDAKKTSEFSWKNGVLDVAPYELYQK